MSSVQRRGDSWQARYRTPDGASRSKAFERKVDAERYLTSVAHQKLTGGYVDPSAGRVTVEAYAEAWRAVQVHRPSTAVTVEAHLRRHIYPVLGHRELAAVRPSEVQSWVKGRSEVLAPTTVELVYRYLASIFRAATEDRIISVSPCRGIKLPKIDRAQVEPITVEQVEGLIDGVDARYRALVILGAGSGLRSGEALGLTVDRVDFLRRTVKVDRQLVLVKGAPVFGPPKTDASRRTVPVPALVIDAISAHLATNGAGPDGLIFTGANGQAIRRTRFADSWRPVALGLGLPPRTGFHALRHFYASALIHYGESVKVVQLRLGHATASETLDTYSHLWPDSEDRTRAAVEAAFSDQRVHSVSTSGTL